jgi:hypothetical protein
VVVASQVDPPVLGRYERGAEHETADDRRSEPVETSGLPGDGRPFGRQDIAGGTSQRLPEIDEHVQTQEHEPNHRRRPVQPARDLEGVPVQQPHRDAAAEEDDRRHDEQRCQQTHRRLWRSVCDIGTTARVVAREPPAGAEQLEDNCRDQGEADEHVPRHERVHTEQDGGDLDEDRSEQKHSHRRGQALVSVGIHSVAYLSGTATAPGRRR